MNPTSSESCSKPYFFSLYKALQGTFSKHTEIPLKKKIQDSLKNSESKGSFSQNTLKSILFN